MKDYKKYISSVNWKKKRRSFLGPGGMGKCERCGNYFFGKDIHVHHKHYHTIGFETREDIEIVCTNCHFQADTERAQKGKQNSTFALYHARLRGWADKVYGRDWELIPGAKEEFEEWLEWNEDEA